MPNDGIERKDTLGLVTLDEKGKPPKYRLPNARATQELVLNLINAAQPRAAKKAMAQGLRDGNPPYSSKKLKDAGQLNRTNIPTMEADALVCSAVAPYYDLFSSTKHPIYPILDFGEDQEHDVLSRVLAEEIHTLIKRWRSWHNQWWPMFNDFIWPGKGFFMFMDDEDWRFKWIEEDRILIPDDTAVDLDDWETLTVLQRLPVHRLWAKLKSGKAGWSEAAVTDAIRNAMPRQPNTLEPMDIERTLNEKSFLWENSRVATVQLANVFVKEFNGKWSWLIVLEPSTGNTTNSQNLSDSEKHKDAMQFLYEGRDVYDGPEQFIAPFFFEVTHRNVNELNGMGKKVYGLLSLNDRVFCTTTDGVFLRSGVTVQAKTTEAQQKMGIVQIGSMNVLPPNLDVQQAGILADVNTALQHSQSIRLIVSGNTGIYRPQVEKAEGNPPTATEFTQRQQQAAVLSNSAVDRFYDQADRFYQEFVRRIFICAQQGGNDYARKEAKALKDRCLKRGMPEQVFEVKEGRAVHIQTVEAYRALGNGSVAMRQQVMGTLAQVSAKFPEDGQENFWEDFIATFATQSKVDRWMPTAARKKQSTVDESFALVENAAIKIGAPVSRAPGQNDVIHAQTHLGAAAQAAQSLSQGANPHEVYTFLDGAGQHIAAHLQAIQDDSSRKTAFKALEEQFKQLGYVHDQLKAKLQKEAQQQQEAQQANQQAQAVEQAIDPKTRIKAAESQAKIQMAAQKNRAMLQMKAQAHQQKMAIQDATAAADIRRKFHEWNAKQGAPQNQ